MEIRRGWLGYTGGKERAEAAFCRKKADVSMARRCMGA
jgi:hypothetical protein